MGTIEQLTDAIGAWWEAATIKNINKVAIHPALESLTTLPKGVLVLSWDKVSFQSIRLGLNDQAELEALVDCLVPGGKAVETVDSILEVINQDPSLGHAVLSTQVSEVDLSNPSQGLEGFTMRITYKR
jgi:hypothetical protein